jgi:hypothetical protein
VGAGSNAGSELTTTSRYDAARLTAELQKFVAQHAGDSARSGAGLVAEPDDRLVVRCEQIDPAGPRVLPLHPRRKRGVPWPPVAAVSLEFAAVVVVLLEELLRRRDGHGRAVIEEVPDDPQRFGHIEVLDDVGHEDKVVAGQVLVQLDDVTDVDVA